MQRLPTIKVNDDNHRGWKIINATSFDPKIHTEYGTTGPDEFTREDIAAMSKADVIDLLEMHGAEFDKRAGVAKLREQLTAVMFMGA